jgi:tetratricopeptide (TPR) repeat protein
MTNRYLAALLLALSLMVGCNRDPEAAKKKYIESGNKYFDRGKYKEALIMYRNALKRDLKFGEAYYRSALAELKLQRFAEAARSLHRAVELQPENLDAHNRLTNLYLNVYLGERQRPKHVLDELKGLSERYAKGFPNSYERSRLNGYLALFENDIPAALKSFEQANRIKPFQQDLVLIYMQALIASNRAEEGEKLAYAMLEKDPAALSVYDSLFLHYARQRKLPEAEQILKIKVAKNPKVADAHLQLAAHYFTTRQREQMLSALQQITGNAKDFPEGPLRVGDFFLRTREYDLAAQHYNDGIKRSPDEKHKYQKRLAEVLVKQNRKDEASRMVAQIISEDPKDSEAIAMRASLSLLTGTSEQLQSAINDLQSVISKMPDNAVVRYNLGRALLAKGSVDQAKGHFEEAVKILPNYLLPRIALTQMMLQRRDYSKVAQMAQEILAYDNGNAVARLLRSRALMGLGDFKQARQELAATAQAYPDLAEARLQLAAIELQEKNFGAAEEGFRRVYEKSQDPRALMGIVETNLARNQAPAALKLLRDEIAKFPNRLEYRVALANISAGTQDFKTALAEYGNVLEKSPQNAQIWLQLAETHRRAGDIDQALSGFQKARELAPADVRPVIQLAVLLDTRGQKSEAKPLYEQALRLEPNNPIALNNLAYLLAESGADLDQALTMAQRATQQRPNDFDIADTLGWIYIKKNLPDSAIGIYRRLVEQAPGRPLYRYHLAMALNQKGDKVQAKKELEQALKSKPPKDEESRILDLLAKLG